MRKIIRVVLGATALALTAGTAQAAHIYRVNFQPLNGSGVTGNALLTLSEDRNALTIEINAFGLVPNANHPGHIHGRFGSNGQPINSFLPTLAQDTDGDGFVEVAEGSATYGPIILGFPELEDAGPEAPDGVLRFRQTFNLLDNSIYADNDMDGRPDFTREDLIGRNGDQLQLREIVLHGMFVAPGPGAGTPGEVNGTNGYLAALPAAAGQIEAIPEPATWAMMIGGFGMIGSAMRRRARVNVSFA